MTEFEELCYKVEETIREALRAYEAGNMRGAELHAQTAKVLAGDAEQIAKSAQQQPARAGDGG